MSDAYQFAIGRSRALALAGCFVTAAVLLFFAGTITGMLVSNNRISTLKAAALAPAAIKPAPTVEPKPPNTSDQPGVASAPETPSWQTEPTPDSSTASTIPAAPATQPMPASSPNNATSMQAATSPKPEAPAPSSPSPSTAAVANNASGSLSAGPPATTTAPVATEAKSQSPVSEAASPRLAETSYAVPLAVKVSSFLVKSNADALMVSLRDLGYRPVMSHFTDTRGQLWYLVKLGPYSRWNTASAVATRVSLEENVRPIIGPMQ